MKKHVRKLWMAALAACLLAGALPAWGKDTAEAYRIGPSDIIEVIVWKEDNLTRRDLLVRPDGRLSMPLADDVVAAGLTPMELKISITKSLERFIASPKVYIIVANPRSHNYSVLGNVVNSGNFPLLSPTSVLQGVAMAGGFNEWAHKDDIVVLRGIGAQQKRIPVVYSDVLAGKNGAQDLELVPGDMIIVP